MDDGELVLGQEEENMELPPGFRFHPTDEELITHYLCNKVMDPRFTARAIGDVDLNKCEPWDLPLRAKMGEKEWYFFCVRDRKYPTGLRTNRATEAGYWKATGKDKDINRGKCLVGTKKTLVFYRGRAPKGERSNWVMHEYRLDGKHNNNNLSKTTRNEWVICRVFNKGSTGLGPLLPPLMEVGNPSKTRGSDITHVTCFSNAMEGQRGPDQELFADCYITSEASPSTLFQGGSGFRGISYPTASLVQLLESNGCGMKQRCKTEREMFSISQDTGLTSDVNPEISSVFSNNEMGGHQFDCQEAHPSSCVGALQLDECFWSY